MKNSIKQFPLAGQGIKLIFKDNMLAVLSDSPLSTVSSAFHNGGFKETKVIINAQVPQDYNDSCLHQDPENFIQNCFNKLELEKPFGRFVGMITFAVVEAFSLVTMGDGDLAVSVVATAGCTHAESAGEKIYGQPVAGTINLIVIIDGNPSESCLVSSIITATEAKTAALKELDVRSLYTGKEATGTPTDAIVVGKTGRGSEIIYSGPVSTLGQLIGFCTKKAVKEAVAKAPIGGYPPHRSLKERLAERHLSVKKLACELSKVKGLNADETVLTAALNDILKNEAYASILFSAVRLDEQFVDDLVPRTFKDLEKVGRSYGEFLLSKNESTVNLKNAQLAYDGDTLSPFLLQVLVSMVKRALAEKKTENLK